MSLSMTLEQNESEDFVQDLDAALPEFDCEVGKTQANVTFVANIDEHHQQRLTCVGSNPFFNTSKVLEILVQGMSISLSFFYWNDKASMFQLGVHS